MDILANIIIESLTIFFFYFLARYKWNLIDKLLVKDTILWSLFNCIFCAAFWIMLICSYLQLVDWQDIFPVCVLTLAGDILFKRFA